MNTFSVRETPSSVTEDFRPARRRLVKLLAGWAGLNGLGLSACGHRENERPWKGSAFPAFALTAPDGVMHDSHEYLGRPVLINFWATWCPPCRSEMDDLEALHAKLGPKGLQLLAISVDDDLNLVREYLRRETFSFTVLVDGDQHWSASTLHIPGLPTSYLVGSDRLIHDAWLGARPWHAPAMQAAIVASVNLDID